LHGITFVFLAVWFAGQYRRKSYWRIAVGLLAFGVLIEACQRLVTYRSADWLDIAADAAGIAVGMAVAMAGLGGWSLWVENRLSRSRVEASGD
jgi:VanZ family protein